MQYTALVRYGLAAAIKPGRLAADSFDFLVPTIIDDCGFGFGFSTAGRAALLNMPYALYYIILLG
jgi:hypothetical protein